MSNAKVKGNSTKKFNIFKEPIYMHPNTARPLMPKFKPPKESSSVIKQNILLKSSNSKSKIASMQQKSFQNLKPYELHAEIRMNADDIKKEKWLKALDDNLSQVKLSIYEVQTHFEKKLGEGNPKDLNYFLKEAEKNNYANKNMFVIQASNEIRIKQSKLENLKKEYETLSKKVEGKIAFSPLKSYDKAKGESKILNNDSFCSQKSFSKLASSSFMSNQPKEAPILEKFKTFSGIESFNLVRDTFESYSGKSNRDKPYIMDSHGFISFLNEKEIAKDETELHAIELLFKTNNKTNLIGFNRFFEILSILASKKYPGKSQEVALDNYVNDYFKTKEDKDLKIKDEKKETQELFIALEDPEVEKYIIEKEAFLKKIYDSYKVLDTTQSQGLEIKNFFKMCKKLEICPFLLNMKDCSFLFKICQKDKAETLRSETITYNDFKNLICLMALYFYMKQNEQNMNIPSLAKIQKMISYIELHQ